MSPCFRNILFYGVQVLFIFCKKKLTSKSQELLLSFVCDICDDCWNLLHQLLTSLMLKI